MSANCQRLSLHLAKMKARKFGDHGAGLLDNAVPVLLKGVMELC